MFHHFLVKIREHYHRLIREQILRREHHLQILRRQLHRHHRQNQHLLTLLTTLMLKK
jgi:hypothetical protein